MLENGQTFELSTIYRTHVRDVGRWVERLAGPGFDLPDLVHEVFEVVQRRLPSFRGDSSLATWLFGVTRKVVCYRRRKDRLRRWLSGSADDEALHVPASELSQHEQLEQKERIASVYRILDRLSQRDREILVLFELEEMPGKQIADLLGIKESAVWLRLHRARARFLKTFKKTEAALDQTRSDVDRSGRGRYGHAG